MSEMTPERLREYAAEDCEVSTQRDFILVVATAWAADRDRGIQLEQEFAIDHAQMQARIEALEKRLARHECVECGRETGQTVGCAALRSEEKT